jgi:hypothetical protein
VSRASHSTSSAILCTLGAPCALPRRRSGEMACVALVQNVFLTPCRYERPGGLLITVYVYLVYVIALRYEGYEQYDLVQLL